MLAEEDPLTKKLQKKNLLPMVIDPTQATGQAAMEDILSSIRTGVEEEGAKVGNGSADLIDAAAAQDGEEDILDLSPADMVGGASGEEEDELIDIAAFASTGEAKTVDTETAAAMAADMLGEVATDVPAEEPVAAPAPVDPAGGAADEFDRLLAEISQEQQQQVAAAEVSKQALMDEEDPLGIEPEAGEEIEVVATSEDADVASEELVETVTAAAMAEFAAPAVPMTPSAASYDLGLVDGPQGVQVAFPAEVLALALRPMVQDWLAKNLPGVVEKLVKEEISKLTQN